MTDHDQDAAIGALIRRHAAAKRTRAALLGELDAATIALEEVAQSLQVVTSGGAALISETAYDRQRDLFARCYELQRAVSASGHELAHTQRLLRDAGVDVA